MWTKLRKSTPQKNPPSENQLRLRATCRKLSIKESVDEFQKLRYGTSKFEVIN